MKIIFITCFLAIFFISNNAKSETLIASIIHNHKKQLSSSCNFDIIRFNEKHLLIKPENSLENNIQTVQKILNIDKNININETIKYLASLRKDAFISLGRPNHELIKKRDEQAQKALIEENQLNSNQNPNQRVINNRGFNFKIISISF